MALRVPRRLEYQWDRFVGLCSRHSVLFRVLTTLVVFSSGFLASYVLVNEATIAFEDVLVAGGMLLVAGFFEALREIVGEELISGRTTASRRRDARRILELAGEALIPAGVAEDYGPDTKLLRANVMRHDRYGRKLCVWESYNMDGDGDRELEIDDGTGVAGHVFQRCDEPHVFDLRDSPDDPRANVAPVQANHAVRSELQTVLSAPILQPYVQNPDPGPDDKIGVLNFDSDLPPGEMEFHRSEIQDFAVTIADLIAVTLEP